MPVLLLVLLIFFLLAPRFPRRSMAPMKQVLYAHRGLWGSDIPENSLPAFARAAENGFGIELDVHLTKDGQLVVHHDSSLMRLCGVDKNIEECTLREIRQYRLKDTQEPIPTLDEVLALVADRAPLIVEVKCVRNASALCQAVYGRLRHHPGLWCVESFDPRCVLWFRRHAPEVMRGQLAFGLRAGRRLTPQGLLMASLAMNALGRPDFVAYEAASDTKWNLPMRLLRLMRPTLAAWTLRSQEELDRAQRRYDLLIFEGFTPREEKS